MKFGRTLRDRTLKEWRFYTVDYKALKKSLKLSSEKELVDSANSDNESDSGMQQNPDMDTADFFRLLEASEEKLSKFYGEKERWAFEYMKTLEERVTSLREVVAKPGQPGSPTQSETSDVSLSPSSSSNSLSDAASSSDEEAENEAAFLDFGKVSSGSNEWLKEEYRRMGASKHFHKYIYAKKSLMTFHRELELLLEFLELNKTAFSKILKKFDKKTGSSIRESRMAQIMEAHKYLDGAVLQELQDEVSSLIEETNSLKPILPRGWEGRKVYTIGCFDLFHRGHQNVLQSLREFGYFIVAGIHDDESYFKLKNKYTIDNLETRMANVKPFVDQLFVIPSTDPLTYIKSMVSDQDIATGACCYARGDDMLQFPGREWVESVMPVHFVPRTEACSSTLIRTIYHAEDDTIRAKAAFAKTRYDGKPVDEDGNILNLKKQ
jgi:cytidyltransferase-like protein